MGFGSNISSMIILALSSDIPERDDGICRGRTTQLLELELKLPLLLWVGDVTTPMLPGLLVIAGDDRRKETPPVAAAVAAVVEEVVKDAIYNDDKYFFFPLKFAFVERAFSFCFCGL